MKELRKARRIARKAAREIRRVKRRYGIDPQEMMPESLQPDWLRHVIATVNDVARYADTGEPADPGKIDLTDMR